MARFSKWEVTEAIRNTGLVPVFYDSQTGIALQVIKACYRAGVRVFEFTNRGDFAHLVFAGLEKAATQEYPEMILGAGSVTDEATALCTFNPELLSSWAPCSIPGSRGCATAA